MREDEIDAAIDKLRDIKHSCRLKQYRKGKYFNRDFDVVFKTLQSCKKNADVHKKDLADIPERADLEQNTTIPEGWKLVPIEPTDDMLKQGWNKSDTPFKNGSTIYKAMIAAAPQPPKGMNDD